MNEITRRRWQNFRANKRAFWSLRIFLVLFVICLFAEMVANERPLAVRYQGDWQFPAVNGIIYEEADFGGDPGLNVDFADPNVECLILTGGNFDCIDIWEAEIGPCLARSSAGSERGTTPAERRALRAEEEVARAACLVPWETWMDEVRDAPDAGIYIRAPIPYAFDTYPKDGTSPLEPPSWDHLLGTDNQTRDVLARVIYGFRISVLFGLTVTLFASIVGICAGAIQGFFGGLLDLIFQRVIEIWQSTPGLYVIIIMAGIFTMNFAILTFLIILFSWTTLVGVVRAEFLRARNFEYVRAARALGVSNTVIMFRHILPNAVVATITLLPFVITAAIGTLTGLDFLGFGLPPAYPRLGELALQAKSNLQAPHLAFVAFFSITIILTLMVFIFEGVRDAFDPRKTFR